MAEKLQVTVGYISQIEHGITKISLDTLSNICEYLDCMPSEILDGTTSDSSYMMKDLSEILFPLSRQNKKLIYEMAKLLREFQDQ